MRLLLATSEFAPFRGGIGTYAYELACAAADAGHEVVVLAPDYGKDQSELDRQFAFTVERYAATAASMKGLPGRISALRRVMRGRKFDAVHAIDWPFFIPMRLARKLAPGARFLMTVHGSEIAYMQAPKRRFLLDLIGFWEKGWARWVANSGYTRDFLLGSFPKVRDIDVVTEPLAVSADWLTAREDRASARAALGVPEDAVVILSLGRVVPRKGHAVIAEALALLPPEVLADVRWWVVGPLLESGHAEALQAAAARLSASTSFFGAVPSEEVRRRIAASDIFCLPGYRDEGGRVEGFGLVFLEAGAFGVPAVATDSGGIPEAVERDRTGLLVPERDAQALADALLRMIEDRDLRARLGAAARDKAEGTTWAEIAARTYGWPEPSPAAPARVAAAS